MNTEYRYRLIAPTMQHWVSIALFMMIAGSLIGTVISFFIGIAVQVVFASAFGWGGSNSVGAGLLFGFATIIISAIGTVAATIWCTIRWWRFGGAELAFVRPSLIDKAEIGANTRSLSHKAGSPTLDDG